MAEDRSIAEGGGGEVGNSRLVAWLGMACWSSAGCRIVVYMAWASLMR